MYIQTSCFKLASVNVIVEDSQDSFSSDRLNCIRCLNFCSTILFHTLKLAGTQINQWTDWNWATSWQNLLLHIQKQRHRTAAWPPCRWSEPLLSLHRCECHKFFFVFAYRHSSHVETEPPHPGYLQILWWPQRHYTVVVGFEPWTSLSRVWRFTTEPLHSTLVS